MRRYRWILRHGVGATDGAVLGDGGVGVLGEADALATRREGRARARDVLGGARPVAGAAEALLGLLGAGHVGLLRLVGDACARLGELVNPLVRAIDAPAVARANVATVEHVLHRQIDVDALALARNLDAVAQGRDGAVRPARTAVPAGLRRA